MKFKRKKLKNGITVLFEKRDVPVVSASISNPLGGMYENSKNKGISHVIEHILFTGTKTRTHEDISREIEKKGGILNAFTAQAVTSFWFKLPSEHLFSGFDILVDMLKNAIFNKEKFEKEKKVILEEIKMYHDSPRHYVESMIEKNLYGAPFGEGIIGSHETVSALDRDKTFKHFKDNYAYSNFVVCVVGDADFDKICNYFEKAFEKKEGETKPEKITKKNADTIEEREGIDQAHLIFATHAPFIGEDDYYSLQVLDAYLADGMSSKLFLTIREEKGLAYSVSSSINAEKGYSHYSIYVGTRKDAIEQVKKLILEGFKNVEKMTEKDLEEAKERIIGLRKVSSEESVNVMNELVYLEFVDKAENYYKTEERIRKVKLADVKRLAKIKSHSFAALVPK